MSDDSHHGTTLLQPDAALSESSRLRSSWTLPPDLRDEAVRRVRALALVYALAYFLAGELLFLISDEGRRLLFSHLALWLPSTVSIAGALLVAWLMSRPGVSTTVKLNVGLAFEVLGSVGIAASEYHGIVAPITYSYGVGGFGLSWVAVWVLLYTTAVPAPPRLALLTAALSLSAIPVMYVLGENLELGPMHLFFVLVFPHLIVLLMAYLGSRVVSRLGAAVTQAREMGSYRLVERLGRGGMGEVWRARHRMLARPAAIKLIRPEVLGAKDPDTRALLLRRFDREAQATALLRSSHTMELYDFGVTDDGTFYYVMELLDGFDLNELVERFGPLPPERAIHLLRQVCDSLGEAHEAGLIHRDVKPANLYACRYGREVDFIKVLDFGLVKQGPGPEEGDKLTAADIGPGGTPAYMSPEQALRGDEVDGRTDIYSLGCVGYWLLTGSLVFKGATPLEAILMHVNHEPEPPSRRTTLPIPPELESIVMACLAKDPAHRPQSADDLAQRLEALSMSKEWTPARARAWWETTAIGYQLSAISGAGPDPAIQASTADS